MNKLLSILTAVLLALAMNGFAVAADQSRTDQQAPQAQTGQTEPGHAGDITEREQEYLAALKKCDSLSGDQKTKCIDAARKKFGQM